MPRYVSADASQPLDPATLLARCVESGAGSLLIDADALPPEFFDLSAGLAGELLHKLGTYRVRLACVVPDPSIHSQSFQDFAREANAGKEYRFFPTRQEAADWLEGPSALSDR